MQPINKVFIIGNGFDLSLGLPTSYADFIRSPHFLKNLPNSDLFEHIKNKAALENWIDIEAELAVVSISEKIDPYFFDDYKLLCSSLSDYMNSIDISTINTESPAYQMLSQNYSQTTSYVANFNYTNTVQYILKSISVPDNEIAISTQHIHGECRNGNIIFGVDDHARTNPAHIFLYKSTSNHSGGRGIKNALKTATQIFFFGHSLGESDHMYLRDFFSRLISLDRDIHLHFYCYGEAGFHDLHKQLRKLTGNNVSTLKSNNSFNIYNTKSTALT